jgi:hypothetical protein
MNYKNMERLISYKLNYVIIEKIHYQILKNSHVNIGFSFPSPPLRSLVSLRHRSMAAPFVSSSSQKP